MSEEQTRSGFAKLGGRALMGRMHDQVDELARLGSRSDGTPPPGNR